MGLGALLRDEWRRAFRSGSANVAVGDVGRNPVGGKDAGGKVVTIVPLRNHQVAKRISSQQAIVHFPLGVEVGMSDGEVVEAGSVMGMRTFPAPAVGQDKRRGPGGDKPETAGVDADGLAARNAKGESLSTPVHKAAPAAVHQADVGIPTVTDGKYLPRG